MKSQWMHAPPLWCVIKHGGWERRRLVAVGALETGCSFSAAKFCIWLITERLISNIVEMLNSMGKIKKLRGVEGLALLGQIISEAPWQWQCCVQWWHLTRVVGLEMAHWELRAHCCLELHDSFLWKHPRYKGGPHQCGKQKSLWVVSEAFILPVSIERDECSLSWGGWGFSRKGCSLFPSDSEVIHFQLLWDTHFHCWIQDCSQQQGQGGCPVICVWCLLHYSVRRLSRGVSVVLCRWFLTLENRSNVNCYLPLGFESVNVS